jgi:hypothetical protein
MTDAVILVLDIVLVGGLLYGLDRVGKLASDLSTLWDDMRDRQETTGLIPCARCGNEHPTVVVYEREGAEVWPYTAYVACGASGCIQQCSGHGTTWSGARGAAIVAWNRSAVEVSA